MSDDDHIIKEIRRIYARGNMLIPHFKHCTVNVKITLLKTYCSTLYCYPWWLNFVKIQLVKYLLPLTKCVMPLWMFLVILALLGYFWFVNFPHLRRKLVFSFMTRIKESSHVLISNPYHLFNDQCYAEVLE